MTGIWTHSPQDVDPLSWFTGPRMPIAFSIAAVLQGIAITVIYWDSWSSALLQLLAMPFFLGAGWLTATSAQPNRPRFRLRDAAGILALACSGVVVSAAGTYGGTMPVAQWWPGIALAATLVSIAPYCTPRKLLICSFPLIAFTGIVGWIVFSSQTDFWPPAAIVIIAVGPVTIGAAGGVVFSYTVVSRTLALLDTSAGVEEFYAASDVADADQQRDSIARVSARVAPFLERVAAAGEITAENRALAAQIARRLRTELVTATSRSWLDVVAHETGMIVSDPARLADSMNESQRTALRALVVAAMGSPMVDQRTVLIELRAQPDGSTAVALSIDVDLPEGRRLVLLAPYYLTLKTTVDDLSWDDGRSLLMRFRIPPA
ncbi:MAG: hypothetical protein QOD50_499 [Actinomycetota bacterium]|nr:hypothetical protein [Actinomycetota bacterium]